MFAPKAGSLLPASLALLLAGACAATDDAPEIFGAADVLYRLQPADIAVAPIQNQTGNPALPQGALREAFAKALLERLYSPLDLDYVDGNWVDASFGGTPAPDALLMVVFKRWDAGDLYQTGKIEAAAEFFLFEGGSTTGTLLWGRELVQTIDMQDGRGVPPGPSRGVVPEAARRFAREAMRVLPDRDPIAAHP